MVLNFLFDSGVVGYGKDHMNENFAEDVGMETLSLQITGFQWLDVQMHCCSSCVSTVEKFRTLAPFPFHYKC